MNSVSQKQLSSESIKRCAVFKINLAGQFVFVDEKFEQILKTKGEQLFGKNIQNYVDADSFDLIKTFLNSRNRFE